MRARFHWCGTSGVVSSSASASERVVCRTSCPVPTADARRGGGAGQLQEDLEQLKCIEHGYKIKVIMVDHCAHGVDEPEDIASIEAIIAKNPAEYA
jgi:hypothetical protein